MTDLASRFSDEEHIGMAAFSPSMDPAVISFRGGLTEGADFLLEERPQSPLDTRIPLPAILAPPDSHKLAELQRRGHLLRTFAEELGGGVFWELDAFTGPLGESFERSGWAQTRSLGHLALDQIALVRVYLLALQLYQPSALDLFECIVNGGWGFRLAYDATDLEKFRQRLPSTTSTPVWVADRVQPYGYLQLDPIGGVAAVNAAYLSMLSRMIADRPHLNQIMQDGGTIASAVYRYYADVEDLRRLQDGPSACMLLYGETYRDKNGRVYERTSNVERRMVLGVVYDTRDPNLELWLWPPEDVWLALGRCALSATHSDDQSFIERRARMLVAGTAEALSRAEWKTRLRLGSRRRRELRAIEKVEQNTERALYDLQDFTGWTTPRGLWDLDQLGEDVPDMNANNET
jgi:hypothetical protein